MHKINLVSSTFCLFPLNRRFHLEMFNLNQLREKNFNFLRSTGFPMLQFVFFVTLLIICIIFLVEVLRVILSITSSYCMFINLPIPYIMVNFLFKKVIVLTNSFEQHNRFPFLLSQYFIPAIACGNHLHIITYNIRSKMIYMHFSITACICGFI